MTTRQHAGAGRDVTVAGYVFTPTRDSPGNDIRKYPALLNIISAACNANARCVGFNSNGWIKSKLLPIAQWEKWTDNRCLGFYTKKR